MVEIKGFKTGHYLGVKTALVGPISAGSEGHVGCPESEPANDDIQFSRSRMISAHAPNMASLSIFVTKDDDCLILRITKVAT
jgi:hypothetical protein